MKKCIALFMLMAWAILIHSQSFKATQKRYPRVRQAYAEKYNAIEMLLAEESLNSSGLRIYLRAFKTERKLEVWAKNSSDTIYKLLKQYDICNTSGNVGPKRRRGDLQIPEGFYHIDRFNPYSNFYLSLGLNYPNSSDRILGYNNNLGGDIFIHGACVTIGCIPVTNRWIKELYVLCVEAKNAGQHNIPVTIFPAKLEEKKYQMLTNQFKDDDILTLWSALKKAYGIFNRKQQLPTITFLSNGQHLVSE